MKMTEKIWVENKTDKKVKVCINIWGTGGNDSYYEIKPYDIGRWARKCWPGYIMVVDRLKAKEQQEYYYIKRGGRYKIQQEGVMDNKTRSNLEPMYLPIDQPVGKILVDKFKTEQYINNNYMTDDL